MIEIRGEWWQLVLWVVAGSALYGFTDGFVSAIVRDIQAWRRRRR